MVVSVALGQPDGPTAAKVDESLLETAGKSLRRLRVPARSLTTGASRSGPAGSRLRLVVSGSSGRAIVWPGLELREAIAIGRLRSVAAGTVVGSLAVSAPWGFLEQLPLAVAARSTG